MFEQGTRIRRISSGQTGTCTGWWKDYGGGTFYYAATMDDGASETFMPLQVEVIPFPAVEIEWRRTTTHHYKATVPAELLRQMWTVRYPDDAGTVLDDLGLLLGDTTRWLGDAFLLSYETKDYLVDTDAGDQIIDSAVPVYPTPGEGGAL